jgi:sugar lactone lactonase YvrE
MRLFVLAGIALGALTAVSTAHPGSGLVVTPAGVVYFLPHYSPRLSHRIYRRDAEGKVEILVDDARLEERHDLFLRPDGSLWTAARGKVWRVEPATRKITELPPAGVGDNGGDPFAVAPDGVVIFADSSLRRSRILRWAAGAAPKPVAGSGRADLRDLHVSRFRFGPDGRTLFLTNRTRIRTIAANGEVATFAGSEEAGAVDGDRADARFRGVYAMAFDAEGNLFVSDRERIRRIGKGGEVSTVLGAADAETGERAPMTFDDPTGLAFGPKGELFVLDRDGMRLSRLDLRSGRVEVVAKVARE